MNKRDMIAALEAASLVDRAHVSHQASTEAQHDAILSDLCFKHRSLSDSLTCIKESCVYFSYDYTTPITITSSPITKNNHDSNYSTMTISSRICALFKSKDEETLSNAEAAAPDMGAAIDVFFQEGNVDPLPGKVERVMRKDFRVAGGKAKQNMTEDEFMYVFGTQTFPERCLH
jgi:hypothetical protein